MATTTNNTQIQKNPQTDKTNQNPSKNSQRGYNGHKFEKSEQIC